MKTCCLLSFASLICILISPGWAQEVRIRPNISRLTARQIESLRRGVEVMESRSDMDPTSWAFQANIHGVPGTPTDPLFKQCQHGTLHFLTWHRGYLYYFERILREASGDPELALPYWDWSSDRTLPLPFRQPVAGNPLFHHRAMNNGAALPISIVAIDRDTAMGQPAFSVFSQLLEQSPHGTIHTLVGGSGDMSWINRSARDPIFWLHHANVDRLWNEWLNTTGHANPSDSAFLDRTFEFASERGERVTVQVRDIISSQQLGYRYDSVPNPTELLSGSVHGTFKAEQGAESVAHAQTHHTQPGEHAPRPSGVSVLRPQGRLLASSMQRGGEEAVAKERLGFEVKRIELKRAEGATTKAAAPNQGQILLELHGLRAEVPPPFTYSIYLNMPDSEVTEEERLQYYAGTVNFFGVAEHEADGAGHEHATSVQEFDVTRVVRHLSDREDWNISNVSVTLVPVVPIEAPGAMERKAEGFTKAAKEAQISFERVDLRIVPSPRTGSLELSRGHNKEHRDEVRMQPSLPKRVALPKPPETGTRALLAPALPLSFAGRAIGETRERTRSEASRLDVLLTQRRLLAKQLDLLDASIARTNETICGGTTDFQDVEKYDGSLGLTREFVIRHEAAVGQLQWLHDLPDRFNGPGDEPGNVNGVRWGSGGLIAPDLFLTAGHCFDQDAGGWDMPRRNGEIVSPREIARLMKVNFKYQVASSSGRIRIADSFPVVDLLEYRDGGLDYALVRLGPNARGELPGAKYGQLGLASNDAIPGATLCLIQHPNGLPKKIHAGPLRSVIGSQVAYATLDTLGGSSGSPLIDPNGLIVGVHTNGGCDEVGGFNFGVAIATLRNASRTAPLSIRETKTHKATNPQPDGDAAPE